MKCEEIENCKISSYLMEELIKLIKENESLMPSILLAGDEAGNNERLMLGWYEKDIISKIEYKRVVKIDGIKFLVIQDEVINELRGKELGLLNGHLTSLKE